VQNTNIKHLLKSISKTQIGFEKEYSRSGMNFNLFSITKIERKEVDTHSAILAELLDPYGSHYQGTMFLELLFNSIEYLKNIDLDFSSAKVKKEKSFDEGRIDIIIEFSDFIVIIENKIDAADQKLQLKRYDNIAKKINKKYIIIYLTKYGTAATKDSCENINYEIMSYEKDILKWIENSIKEMSLIPQIREILVQYLNLIKKITGVNLTINETEEIVNDIKNNMIAAKAICSNYKKAQIELINDFFTEIHNIFQDKLVFSDQLSNKSKEHFILDENNKINKTLITNWIEKNGNKKIWEVKHLLLQLPTSNPNIIECFTIMLATDWLHYGFVNLIKNDEGKFDFAENKDIYKNNNYEGFEQRDWAFGMFYSKSREFRRIDDDVLKLISKPDSFIEEIKDFF